jgi:predicted negative regulator of RcsB-dependent stress response
VAEKKISRKELLKEPDEFLTTSAKVIGYTRENPRQVTTGVIIAVVCLVGALGWYGFRKHQDVKSLQMFDKAFRQYHEVLFSSETQAPEQLDKLLTEFEAVARDYGSLPAGEMAQLYCGHVLYKKGDFKGALDRYERLRSSELTKRSLEPLVMYHVAMTRFALQDYEQAESVFTQLSKDTNSPYRREAFAAIAHIYESMGKNKEAAQAYKQYLKMFPEAPDAAFIRARLAELSMKG